MKRIFLTVIVVFALTVAGYGQTTRNCTSCNGTGRQTSVCTGCNGTGVLQMGWVKMQCTLCGGQGRIQCFNCNATGKVTVTNELLAQEAHERGITAYRANNYDLAIKEFTEVIRLAPNADGSYQNRGRSYQAKGDNTRAIADYNKALQINPNNAQARDALIALGVQPALAPTQHGQAQPMPSIPNSPGNPSQNKTQVSCASCGGRSICRICTSHPGRIDCRGGLCTGSRTYGSFKANPNCRVCSGSGFVMCTNCSGSGKCKTCGGTGWR